MNNQSTLIDFRWMLKTLELLTTNIVEDYYLRLMCFACRCMEPSNSKNTVETQIMRFQN